MANSSGFDHWLGGRTVASLGTESGGFAYWLGGQPLAVPSISPFGGFDHWFGAAPLATRSTGTSSFDFWCGRFPAPVIIRAPGPSTTAITRIWQTVVGQHMAWGLVTNAVTGFHGALPLPAAAGGLLGGFDYWWTTRWPMATRSLPARRFDYWQGSRPFPLLSNRVAAVSGTITASVSEVQMRAGGLTIVVTLTGDTFIPL